MSARPSRLLHVRVLIGITIACIILFLLLIPNFEAASTEARLATAYHRVQQIAKAYRETRSPESLAASEITDLDPWGQPYRFHEVDGKQMQALSCGPNMLTPEVGVDHDDIYSNMPASPVAPIHAEKKTRFIFAAGVSIGAWLLLSVAHLRSHRSKRELNCDALISMKEWR